MRNQMTKTAHEAICRLAESLKRTRSPLRVGKWMVDNRGTVLVELTDQPEPEDKGGRLAWLNRLRIALKAFQWSLQSDREKLLN